VLRTLAKADERHVGPLAGSDGSDVLDIDFARDHLVAEAGDDGSHERETIGALVGDENA
jgi:hypothetical protein